MLNSVGNIQFPIWIIGDSNPEQWENELEYPFDPRHPIRHNIITSVLDVIQEQVYKEQKLRVNTKDIYVRNAIEAADRKPKCPNDWENLKNDIMSFETELHLYKPVIVLTFGAFAYEFVRRANDCNSVPYMFSYRGSERLGKEFRNNTANFKASQINIFPMLHRSIAGGHFLKSHTNYCGNYGSNYFEYAGSKLAKIMLINKNNLNIWL
jgi:uracil-DNA glycosylase